MHITKDGDQWKAKAEGSSRSSVVADTKEEAVRMTADYARRQSEPVSVKIHKQDGTFQEERTYPRSSDPSSSKG